MNVTTLIFFTAIYFASISAIREYIHISYKIPNAIITDFHEVPYFTFFCTFCPLFNTAVALLFWLFCNPFFDIPELKIFKIPSIKTIFNKFYKI